MQPTTLRTSSRDYELAFGRIGTRLTAAGRNRSGSKNVSTALWIVQVLLALLFLFAGGMKLVVPIAMMTKQMPLPGLFLRFIGVAEFAGGLGLILPGLLRIRPNLTPVAAGGLVIIMSGAIGITMAGGVVKPALVPLVLGLLAGFVAYGRTRLAPIGERPRAMYPRTSGSTTFSAPEATFI
jgi:uncharacterized membrane protein YphA (DoxX/SURF4 family)